MVRGRHRQRGPDRRASHVPVRPVRLDGERQRPARRGRPVHRAGNQGGGGGRRHPMEHAAHGARMERLFFKVNVAGISRSAAPRSMAWPEIPSQDQGQAGSRADRIRASPSPRLTANPRNDPADVQAALRGSKSLLLPAARHARPGAGNQPRRPSSGKASYDAGAARPGFPGCAGTPSEPIGCFGCTPRSWSTLAGVRTRRGILRLRSGASPPRPVARYLTA